MKGRAATQDDTQDIYLCRGRKRCEIYPGVSLPSPGPWHEAASSKMGLFVLCTKAILFTKTCVFLITSIHMGPYFYFMQRPSMVLLTRANSVHMKYCMHDLTSMVLLSFPYLIQNQIHFQKSVIFIQLEKHDGVPAVGQGQCLEHKE